MSALKFPLKVYTYGKGGQGCKQAYDIFDLTEEEMQDKCCIYGSCIYWRDSIPQEEYCLISETYVELYDIWNYESVNWWNWPEEQKQIMFQKVPKSRSILNPGARS